ncbi:MAG TPA: FHA domain-containing protein [Anaerolineae bacterium]|nr:FHA domain-containing protein [Anaerolineae bacterium]
MSTSSSRPIGVTLVALLYLSLAVFTLVIAARYVLFPGENEEMILLFTRLELPVTLINLLAVPPLITAGIATLLFRGLWQQRLWGWAATLFFSFLGMLASLMALAFFLAFYFNTPKTMGTATGAFILFALIFIYFLKTSPKPSTTQPSPSPAPAQPLRVQVQTASPRSRPPAAAPRQAPLGQPDVHYETIHRAPTVALPAAQETTLPVAPTPLFHLIATQGPDAGKQFDVFKEDILIGRHPTLADVVLADPTVSARHARILRQATGFQLLDLGSTNGTYLNGKRIQEGALHENDVIRLGATTLVLQFPRASQHTLATRGED